MNLSVGQGVYLMRLEELYRLDFELVQLNFYFMSNGQKTGTFRLKYFFEKYFSLILLNLFFLLSWKFDRKNTIRNMNLQK